MGFNEVANEVFALYDNGKFDEALALIEGAEQEFPDREAEVVFWRACLLGVGGRPEEALDTLRSGIERGQWWSPGQLADTDLDSLRSLPGWNEVETTCSDATVAALKSRPAPIVQEGTSAGSVITIQGAHAVQTDLATTWRAAAPLTWSVITPAGMEPSAAGAWGWPRSVEASAESVLADVENIELKRPLVLAGFSIGSAIACHIIDNALLDVSGLIVVAPSSLGGFDELRRTAVTVPTLLVGGDRDPRHEAYHELRTDLAGTGSVDVQLVEGLGHSNPDDLAERTRSFFDRLLQESTRGQ